MTTHNSRNASNSKQQTATAKACAAPGAVYITETSVASGCVYTTKTCAAHRRIYPTKARAEPTGKRVYTTEESASSGSVYIMVSCAAPEGVYTQRPVFLLEMSTLQGPELHFDVYTLKRPVLLLDMSTVQRDVLHLHMDVSTPQGAGAVPGLVYTTKGCEDPGDVCTTGPELSLDLSTLQWLVLVLDSIREIGSSIPLDIYFEILLS